MLIVCAGMFRSGSTWQYQVACELVRRAGRPATPLGFLEGVPLAAFLDGPRDPAVCYLYKTHAPDPVHRLLPPAEFRVLYSYRDLRDVAYSMAHKFAADFWETVRDKQIIDVCLAADAFWRAIPGAFVQRYESWAGDGLPFVRNIAAHLAIDLPDADLAAVAAEFALDRNQARTADLAERLTADGVDLADRANALRHDPASLLHWNHIRNGTVGGWRAAATPDERVFLAAACGDWLVANGYEPDRSWADRAG